MYSFFFFFLKQDEFELTDFEDYNDDDGDLFSDPVSASGVCVYPAACRVVYSYQVGIFFSLHKVIASQVVVRYANGVKGDFYAFLNMFSCKNTKIFLMSLKVCRMGCLTYTLLTLSGSCWFIKSDAEYCISMKKIQIG